MDRASADGLVSVVVPTYGRRPDFLRAAVESVAAQTYDPVELIVVDDSPEASATAVCEPFASEMATLRVIDDRDHDGAGAARNTGIRAADGSLVAFLDDDDEWHDTKLSRQCTRLEAAPEASLVVTGQQYVRNGTPTGSRLPDVSGDVTEALLTGSRLCPFSSAMVRAEAVDAAGPIDERFPVWEDLEWYVRLSRAGAVATVDRPLVRRRMGDHEQLTDTFDSLRDVAYPLFVRKHRPLAASLGERVEREFVASLAREVATAGLGAERFDDAVAFARRSIRANPRAPAGYLLYGVARSGPFGLRLARALRRRFASLNVA
ncbi:glycosyltransferase family 2 protein [Salinigranum rubrum]|uniref:Glycosyltransferase family 2 protein n=1 Tax=Salinigranum rubrum TaxID=755307 RepID=A0A2I8VLI8_9EURY|nr:glycosyltransferase family A protein [Salinigranum rubrum]AUV82754.1 glycosyltransferase family 2 protein [Salinigranum rubrum]